MAFLDEVDSFNPFNGYQASSYEAWALMYDYMVGYSMEDMSPAPALATSWDTSEDGLTWTFDIREGVTWSDGEPLTAGDIAYTYNRVLDGGPEAGNWGTYLTSVETITAPDDTTVVLELERPNAVLPLLPIPILPEHVWSEVAEDDVKSYRNEPTDGEPVVGSGRFRLVEGTAGGSTYVFEANPDYWDGVPHVDRVAFQVYKSEDPAIQALIKGEVDFVDDITAVQVEALQGRDGIHAQNGISPYFEEIAFNVGAVDPETGEPLGDGNPALEDPAFTHALGFALDVDRLVETAYQGAAETGDTFIPTAYESFRWEPPEDEAFTFDLERAGELLDEAGYEIGSDGLRTMPDGSPIGAIRLFARAEEERSADHHGVLLGVAGRDRHRVRDPRDGEQPAHRRDPRGQLRRLPLGLVRRARPGLHPVGVPLRRARRVLRLVVLQRGVRQALPGAERRGRRRGSGSRRSSRCRRSSSGTRPTSSRRTRRTARPSAPTGSRASSRSRTPDGVLLVQYGAFNYSLLRPADEAGDCDGIESAIGPSESSSSSGDDDGQQHCADRGRGGGRAPAGRRRGGRAAPAVHGGRPGVAP